MQKKIILFIVALLFAIGSYFFEQRTTQTQTSNTEADYVLEFPSSKYPETAEHIRSAISKGQSAVCTIDRKGADENREQSLKGVPTKPRYDRDEWPMAMCKEGGKGADIAYISPSDNRGAGSWVANQVDDYPDGTRVKIVIK
ncbi:NucA/NucB deoxyribonuclease domain-containing protein [Brevibacillus choshinensis]|uniref:NucA/NucB deoxyribonuclease domain-containing protein n=1 Tax=Brevibacillus choshinensis TaxID=54911 RepID=UPI000ABC13E2|nr:NucA/NucB deoxyribonuclease domain-containing protein [Brevibacillus choshinensis]